MVTNKEQIQILITRYENRKKLCVNNKSFDRDKGRAKLYQHEIKVLDDVIKDLNILKNSIE